MLLLCMEFVPSFNRKPEACAVGREHDTGLPLDRTRLTLARLTARRRHARDLGATPIHGLTHSRAYGVRLNEDVPSSTVCGQTRIGQSHRPTRFSYAPE